jgi:hypothetical protein
MGIPQRRLGAGPAIGGIYTSRIRGNVADWDLGL